MAAGGPILRVCIGFLVCWLALDRSAAWLGSYRGEFGLAVCAVTLAALLAVEWALFRTRPGPALGLLGLGRPDRRGLATAAGLCLLMLLFYPAYALATGTEIALRPDGWMLAAGLFAQGGVAEESLFRGYLFRRLREGRGFWSAAWLSLIPFVAVHLLLLATLDWPLAVASILLSAASTFWFARLFELGGRTIWAPALAHFTVQGSIKLVAVPDAELAGLVVAWMAVTALVPWLVFAVRRRPEAAP